MARRIGMDPNYLNLSDFARSEILLGSFGLIIFELRLPLTWTETDKLLTQMDYRINKFQPMSMFLLFIASYIFSEKCKEVLEAHGTRNQNLQDGKGCNISYQNALLSACELQLKA